MHKMALKNQAVKPRKSVAWLDMLQSAKQILKYKFASEFFKAFKGFLSF